MLNVKQCLYLKNNTLENKINLNLYLSYWVMHEISYFEFLIKLTVNNKSNIKTPFTRYRYETLPVKNHYVFNYSHGTGRVILVTIFVHFIIEIRTLKCFA